MLTAIVPDPFGMDFPRKEVYAQTPENLVREVRQFITDSGYGSSDVGSLFNVYRDGNIVATITYNGKYHWRDEAYAVD